MPPEGQEASVIRSGMLQAPEDDDKSPIMIEIEPDLNRMLNETREIMKRYGPQYWCPLIHSCGIVRSI